MGEVTAVADDGACDVQLPGGDTAVTRVPNASGIALQPGNRVVLQRLPGRANWQITGGTVGGLPTTYVNPNATLSPPPDGTWDGLVRSATDATGIAAYVDGKQWPLTALTRGSAADGQVPVWSTQAGAWVPGVAASGGLSLDHLRPPAATALAALLNGNGALVPDGIGAWFMTQSSDIDNGLCAGAYGYTARLGDVRRGAYWPQPCMEAYWKMDETNSNETLLDCSEHLDDLTPTNVGACTGPFFGARTFNGTNSYAMHAPLDLTNFDRLTVEMWVKPNSVAPSQQWLYQYNGIAINTTGSGTYLQFNVTTANGNRGTLAKFPADVNLADGAWHYVACVYTGSLMQMYLDGAPFGDPVSQSGTIMTAAPAPGIYLGVYAPHWAPWGYYYNGAMAEVCIDTAVQPASMIAQTWANRNSGTAITSRATTPVPCSYGLLGELHTSLDGQVVYDLSNDDGATWFAASPWTWTHLPTPGTQWRVRCNIVGRTGVQRLGLLCVPEI